MRNFSFCIVIALSLLLTGQEVRAQEIQKDETMLLSDETAISQPFEQIVSDEELAAQEYKITAADRIIVHVGGRFIEVIQNLDDGGTVVKTYPAGTATKGKNTETLPFGAVAKVTSIVFNPYYYPTNDTKKEYFKKYGKQMPKVYPPGKNNPLGMVKLYLSFNGIPSTLGIHDTDNQKSVGKNVSHGCVRLKKMTALELATLILDQNGYEAKNLVIEALNNPKKTIKQKIIDGPEVIFERD